MSRLLRARPLTAAGFAPYGVVLAVPATGSGRAINGGSSQRFDLVDDLQLGSQGGRAQLAIFRAQARCFPQPIDALERHRLGSQSFVPLGARRRFVVVVAPAGNAPVADSVVAFLADGHQGITLAPGVWHHGLLAVDGGDFVVVERVGAEVDCDLQLLSRGLSVGFE